MISEPQRAGRVLVTGSQGYIGSVLVPHLEKAGYRVEGWDAGWFSDCTLLPASREESRRDIRDLRPEDLQGVETIVHLAALSNDPVGDLNSRWTQEINTEASVRLARVARESGVQRFLFSSSCIMYGASENDVCDESSPLDPRTDYARSKVDAERQIAELASDDFSPVFLRNGTVYGVSPRMRLDTVLNHFVAAALTDGVVVVRSNGRPWRPVVHLQDLVRSIVHVMQAPRELIHKQAFNNGCENLNIQISALAEAVASAIPGTGVQILGHADADQRTYRASFAKFSNTFPEFEFQWTPREGAKELFDSLQAAGLKRTDFASDRFVRLRHLNHLLQTGLLDEDLRWTRQEVPSS